MAFLVREIFHCKPGKAGEIVKRFKALEPIMKELGSTGTQLVMTDMSGENYWTVVTEVTIDNIEQYFGMTRQTMSDPRIQTIMQGYHDLVESGKREIYKVE